jgi:hypothetical protein
MTVLPPVKEKLVKPPNCAQSAKAGLGKTKRIPRHDRIKIFLFIPAPPL